MRVLVASATAFGHLVRFARTYGLAIVSAGLVATGAAELTHHRAAGYVIAGAFGLMYDHRR